MPEQLYERLGRAIRHARDARGLTQGDAAARAGLKRTTLTNIEKGEQTVAVHQLLGLAKALGADPAELLARAEAETATAAVPVAAEAVDGADLRAWVVSLTSQSGGRSRR